MRIRSGAFEYDIVVEELTRPGDDFRSWRYNGTDLTRDKEFDWRIQISNTALNCGDLDPRIQEVIAGQGESLIRKWLSEDRGYWMIGIVTEKEIKEIAIKDKGVNRY